MDICLHPALLILALMVSSVPAEPPPRLCHPAGDPRRRLGRFSGESGANYSCLLLSSDGQRLYVGGRDRILSLHTPTLSSTQAVDQIHWRASDAKVQECSSKGKIKQRDCFNFITMVLPLNESHLYACGTYAYSPICTYIDARTFSLLRAGDGQPVTEDGKGRVPFDPALRFTATMVEGALYSGTTGDFRGTQHVISRSLGQQVPLKTEASLSWLQDPSFVASTFVAEPDGDKVYFFFTETRSGLEPLQRMSVALVARVCKDDVGGERVLQKRWTTFLKAQMLCYLPEDKFPLTVLQDVYVTKDEDGTIVHGVFTSQWFHGSSHSSAVCAFSLADIQAVFQGKYKFLNRELQLWSTFTGDIPEPRPGMSRTGFGGFQ
ncbi:semaphorin-4B-like [Rhinoraja longicauda]